MPDADLEVILSMVGHAIPVHVFARLLHDPSHEAKLRTRLGQVLEWYSASSRDEGVCPCGRQQLVDFGMWEVVREQDGCDAEEGGSWRRSCQST